MKSLKFIIKNCRLKIEDFHSGQGVVESVFAVGILALFLGGIIVLIVLGITNRRSSFDRRKATELANIIMEDQISKSQSDPQTFWQVGYTGAFDGSSMGYSGYNYSVGFTNISGDATYPNCGIGVTDCAEIVVNIGWSGKNSQTLNFNRFFSKNN